MDKINKSDEQWQKDLTPEQFYVTRKAGTEPAFTGKYYKTKDPGTYTCACCGQQLFSSETKYESGSGWPSFYKPVREDAVEEHSDTTYGMRRVEVRCGMAIGRLVAAYNVSANEAETQVNPPVARLQTFLTPVGCARLLALNAFEMPAWCHRSDSYAL